MADLTCQFVSVCEGGGHVSLDLSLNGGETRRVVYTTDEIRAPLNKLSQEERDALALLILKVHFAGQTRNQMRQALQAGVTVTV